MPTLQSVLDAYALWLDARRNYAAATVGGANPQSAAAKQALDGAATKLEATVTIFENAQTSLRNRLAAVEKSRQQLQQNPPPQQP